MPEILSVDDAIKNLEEFVAKPGSGIRTHSQTVRTSSGELATVNCVIIPISERMAGVSKDPF